ncbi:ornithine aminotransferase, mitochondrial [Trifolium repens]|nr:ornithine aminotransferase, mitochondrial [Trifolium repens]
MKQRRNILQMLSWFINLLVVGNRKKPNWIFPKTRVQPNDNDCGYYVMKNMIDIVSASVTKKWIDVFNDPTTLTDDDLYELRNRWATCFLDLYNPENDYDDGAEGRS